MTRLCSARGSRFISSMISTAVMAAHYWPKRWRASGETGHIPAYHFRLHSISARQVALNSSLHPKAVLKPRALQTLRACRASANLAKRLECGACSPPLYFGAAPAFAQFRRSVSARPAALNCADYRAQAFSSAFLTAAKSVGGRKPMRFSNRTVGSDPMPCTLATDSLSRKGK